MELTKKQIEDIAKLTESWTTVVNHNTIHFKPLDDRGDASRYFEIDLESKEIYFGEYMWFKFEWFSELNEILNTREIIKEEGIVHKLECTERGVREPIYICACGVECYGLEDWKEHAEESGINWYRRGKDE